MERSRRQQAALPHAAAEHLAEAPRALDERRRAAQRASHRATEALREAHAQRVRMPREGVRRVATGNARIEESRAVHVHVQAVLARLAADAFPAIHPPHRAAATVLRVLRHQHLADGVVHVRRAHRARHVRCVEEPAIAPHRAHHGARERRRRAGLVVDDVAFLVRNDLVARAARHADRQLVGHGAARHVDRSLLARALGDRLLELRHRRLVAQHVVAQRRGTHGVPHGGRRPGHGVGAQVDDRSVRGHEMSVLLSVSAVPRPASAAARAPDHPFSACRSAGTNLPSLRTSSPSNSTVPPPYSGRWMHTRSQWISLRLPFSVSS